MARCRGGVGSKPLHRARPHAATACTAARSPASDRAARHGSSRSCSRHRHSIDSPASTSPTPNRTRSKRSCRLVAAAIAAPLWRPWPPSRDNRAPPEALSTSRCAGGTAWASVAHVDLPFRRASIHVGAARERRAGSGCRPVPGRSARPANGLRRDAPRALRAGARGAVGRRPHVAGGHLRGCSGRASSSPTTSSCQRYRRASSRSAEVKPPRRHGESAGAAARGHGVPDVRRRARPDGSCRDTRDRRTHRDRDTDLGVGTGYLARPRTSATRARIARRR